MKVTRSAVAPGVRAATEVTVGMPVREGGAQHSYGVRRQCPGCLHAALHAEPAKTTNQIGCLLTRHSAGGPLGVDGAVAHRCHTQLVVLVGQELNRLKGHLAIGNGDRGAGDLDAGGRGHGSLQVVVGGNGDLS